MLFKRMGFLVEKYTVECFLSRYKKLIKENFSK